MKAFVNFFPTAVNYSQPIVAVDKYLWSGWECLLILYFSLFSKVKEKQ